MIQRLWLVDVSLRLKLRVLRLIAFRAHLKALPVLDKLVKLITLPALVAQRNCKFARSVASSHPGSLKVGTAK